VSSRKRISSCKNGPTFSGPAFSSPSKWSSVFRSCVFPSCISPKYWSCKFRPSFSGPPFSAFSYHLVHSSITPADDIIVLSLCLLYVDYGSVLEMSVVSVVCSLPMKKSTKSHRLERRFPVSRVAMVPF